LISSLNFTFQKNGNSQELLKIGASTKNSDFTLLLIYKLAVWNQLEIDISNIKLKIEQISTSFNMLNENLKKYTPIEDFRINENYNIHEDQNVLYLSNVFFEFKIKGTWHPFSSLSDGTKRLFYIVSEIIIDYELIEKNKNFMELILLEEPELGIHPHQFAQLMQFLKIESQNKQIIITTHSPQALDVLEENELDRISIAYMNPTSDGTQIRQLTEMEIAKAQAYMKEDYLRDYWIHSDLEA
jgi:predicted ATP-binding protein involved in virulence